MVDLTDAQQTARAKAFNEFQADAVDGLRSSCTAYFHAGYAAALAALPREDEATLVAAVEGVLEQHVEAPMPEAVAFNLQSSYHELAKAIVRALPVAPREDEGLRGAVWALAEIAEYDTNYPDRETQKMARHALARLDPSGKISAKRPRDEPTPGGMTPGGQS